MALPDGRAFAGRSPYYRPAAIRYQFERRKPHDIKADNWQLSCGAQHLAGSKRMIMRLFLDYNLGAMAHLLFDAAQIRQGLT